MWHSPFIFEVFLFGCFTFRNTRTIQSPQQSRFVPMASPLATPGLLTRKMSIHQLLPQSFSQGDGMLCITAPALLASSTSPAVTPQGRACPPRPRCPGWLGHGAGQGQPHAVSTAVPTSSSALGHVEGSRAGKLSWEAWGDTGTWMGRTAG